MKHLLSLMDLNKKDINNILEVASQMRRIVQANYKKGPQLIGSVVGGAWESPCVSSTAFSLGTSYLSGTCCPVFGSEDLLEQCRLFDNMGVNAVVVACENDNLAQIFASKSRCGVINGGSGQYDPIGALADLMAINGRLDGLQNLSVLAVGNRDTNKINELSYCLQQFGSTLIWYLPPDDFATQRKGIVIDKADSAFSGADVVIDLGLSAFADPVKYYGAFGGIPERLMDKARIDCPLLGSRNIAYGNGLREYPNNIVNSRDVCYVSVAMAVLYLMRSN
ncbi:MAG: hypothetical protein NC099_03460 [Corallococcus sp.]|nr:hypothetical protein [Bacillota bacterium]MCM1533691.1 hypothetical protein [Corallococcus sp.]